MKPPATAPPGLEITIDGEKIPEAAWGTALPVDPGEHEVAARAPRHAPWSTKTTVTGKAERSSVSVPVLVVEETTEGPAAPGAPRPGAPATEQPGGVVAKKATLARTLALVSGGLGVVGLGVGTALGLDASSKKSGYQGEQVGGRCVTEACVTTSQQAVSAANASTIAFVAGGVLVAAGAVLWVTAPRDEHTLALVPIAGPQGMGAGVSGAW